MCTQLLHCNRKDPGQQLCCSDLCCFLYKASAISLILCVFNNQQLHFVDFLPLTKKRWVWWAVWELINHHRTPAISQKVDVATKREVHMLVTYAIITVTQKMKRDKPEMLWWFCNYWSQKCTLTWPTFSRQGRGSTMVDQGVTEGLKALWIQNLVDKLRGIHSFHLWSAGAFDIRWWIVRCWISCMYVLMTPVLSADACDVNNCTELHSTNTLGLQHWNPYHLWLREGHDEGSGETAGGLEERYIQMGIMCMYALLMKARISLKFALRDLNGVHTPSRVVCLNQAGIKFDNKGTNHDSI